MISIINSILPAVITGLFAIIMWKLQTAENTRKKNRDKQDERLERIEKSLEDMEDKATKLSNLEKDIWCLSDIAETLKASGDINGEGLKIVMRYMLQRYHAEYMLQGFVTSHQKKDFLEAWDLYKAKRGNGTADSWHKDIEGLPVRDDLPAVNPYLELLKKRSA